MKNKKLLLTLSLLSVLTISGCAFNNNNPVSSSSQVGGTSTSSKPTSIGGNSSTSHTSVDVNTDSYDDSYSESGHLYVHYNRGANATKAEYDAYGLWLWPVGKEGALFANPANAHSSLKTNGTGWMSSIGSKGAIDEAGVCMDIDLKKEDYTCGKINKNFSLKDLERIGYLVVKLSSMDGTTHWISDGGGDGFIEDVSINTRKNGSIHVFLKTGTVRQPSYVYSSKIVVNPITQDTTGNYRSVENLESSKVGEYNKTNSTTSQLFKENGAMGYQLFIPTFADSNGDGFGDLRGVINKLDYLESLSIDTLWLSPFLKSNSYHGYDTVDYYQIDSRFGTMDDLKELISKAHAKGINILMDFVINHSSTSAEWFMKAQNGEEGEINGRKVKYRDLFHFKYKGDITEGTTKVEDDPDWYQDGESNYYYYAKFASNMPEFNFDAQITRDVIVDVANYWLSQGIDGYRLDAIKHIYMWDESKNESSDKKVEDVATTNTYDEQLGQFVSKTIDYSVNTTKNVLFWKELANRVKTSYPNCYFVGENFTGDPKQVSPYYESIDSQFDFNCYYHTLENLYANNGTGYGTAFSLAKDISHKADGVAVTAQYSKYVAYGAVRSDFINATFTSNHDVSRAINHINSTKASQFGIENDVIISGTETQINRAKVHAAVTMLQPGISFIYNGDELGMSSNTKENQNEHNNSIDRFYRQPMKWATESERCFISFGEGYDNSYDSYNKVLKNIDEQTSDTKSMLSFYRDIARVKGDSHFPTQVGSIDCYEYKDNANIYYIVLTPKDGSDDYKYRIWINTGSRTNLGSAGYGGFETGEKVIYKYNATDSQISPYGVVVSRVEK